MAKNPVLLGYLKSKLGHLQDRMKLARRAGASTSDYAREIAATKSEIKEYTRQYGKGDPKMAKPKPKPAAKKPPRKPAAAKKPASKSAPKVNTTRAFVLTAKGNIKGAAKKAGWEPRMHGGRKVAYNTTTKKSFYI